MDDTKGWGHECDDAFWAIKEYTTSPLSLSQPVEGEELYMYLAASATVVSATLVRLGLDSKKRPIISSVRRSSKRRSCSQTLSEWH